MIATVVLGGQVPFKPSLKYATDVKYNILKLFMCIKHLLKIRFGYYAF